MEKELPNFVTLIKPNTMQEHGIKPSDTSVKDLGIEHGVAHWNLPPHQLIDMALQAGQATMASTGAIAIDTGEFTGRSPKDKFIVRDDLTTDTVWWNEFNIPFEAAHFDRLYSKMIHYFNEKEIFVRDVFACADPRYRVNIRVINEYAWSNLFVYNMFLRPTQSELKSFNPDWHILNAPGFFADAATDGTRQHNFSIIDFKRRIILIGGSGYTGEIKKSVFSVLNYILPHKKNVLTMHCSANSGKAWDTAIFFGLSGTGKTTLSADPNRSLIGDDEHGWTPDNIIFNFEGGCYAKTIDLREENEPDIYNAIRTGALLENVVFKNGSTEVDFADGSKTQNTRVSYPIEHIQHAVIPAIGVNPRNIFFLTCDAFGVLPPISRLTPGQAAFHFISGYTAKVAGTEEGVKEPRMTFSACFGAPFMPLHPTRYAEMLSQKMQDSEVKVWLVNTGWSGGSFGVGKRMRLEITRALIHAALTDQLDSVPYKVHDVFGIEFPTTCPAVDPEVLDPRHTWRNTEEYDKKAYELAEAFLKNFEKYSKYANEEILGGAPNVRNDKHLANPL
jgi:phosphoenolpyruvate carboxykinase (ATP)